MAGAVRWRTRAFPDPVTGVAGVNGREGFVVMTSRATIGLDADGEQQWVVRERADRGARPGAVPVGDVVVRYSDPGRPDSSQAGGRIRVIDTRQGQVAWKADVVRETTVAATPRSIYTGSCDGDVCTVAARVPGSGEVRWRTQVSAGLTSIEHVGDAIHVSSLPEGSDITDAPYGEHTAHQVLDDRTGEPRGPERTGNAFYPADQVLIEASYAGSAGRDCTMTLTGRRLGGQELWTRSFDWRLSAADRDQQRDCAVAGQVQALDGGRVEVAAREGFGHVLDAATGRTQWRPGGERLVVASHDDVDVVTSYEFDRLTGRDVQRERPLWRLEGQLSTDAAPEGYFLLEENATSADDQVSLHSISTGEASLRLTEPLVGSGDDWAATVSEVSNGYRVSVVDWPH